MDIVKLFEKLIKELCFELLVTDNVEEFYSGVDVILDWLACECFLRRLPDSVQDELLTYFCEQSFYIYTKGN